MPPLYYNLTVAPFSPFVDQLLTLDAASEDTPLLIPLTTSLYVPGTLATPSSSSSSGTSSSNASAKATVLVDVGTGFYVTKTTDDAITFYTGKVGELAKNLADIEKVVAGKNENLRVIEDGETSLFLVVCLTFWTRMERKLTLGGFPTVLRQKMLTEGQGGGQRAGQAQAAAG